MSKTLIQEVVELIRNGWRPYSAPTPKDFYKQQGCPRIAGARFREPQWFVRGDIFLCLGCSRRCSLNRPEGFMLPLPIKYERKAEQAFALTPAEMVACKSLLRVDETAYCLNISERQVYDWIAEGRLRRMEGAPVRVPAEDVLREMTNYAD